MDPVEFVEIVDINTSLLVNRVFYIANHFSYYNIDYRYLNEIISVDCMIIENQKFMSLDEFVTIIKALNIENEWKCSTALSEIRFEAIVYFACYYMSDFLLTWIQYQVTNHYMLIPKALKVLLVNYGENHIFCQKLIRLASNHINSTPDVVKQLIKPKVERTFDDLRPGKTQRLLHKFYIIHKLGKELRSIGRKKDRFFVVLEYFVYTVKGKLL